MVERHAAARGVCDGQAIGVTCRLESERESRYFRVGLPQQFEEYIWFQPGNHSAGDNCDQAPSRYISNGV